MSPDSPSRTPRADAARARRDERVRTLLALASAAGEARTLVMRARDRIALAGAAEDDPTVRDELQRAWEAACRLLAGLEAEP